MYFAMQVELTSQETIAQQMRKGRQSRGAPPPVAQQNWRINGKMEHTDDEADDEDAGEVNRRFQESLSTLIDTRASETQEERAGGIINDVPGSGIMLLSTGEMISAHEEESEMSEISEICEISASTLNTSKTLII